MAVVNPERATSGLHRSTIPLHLRMVALRGEPLKRVSLHVGGSPQFAWRMDSIYDHVGHTAPLLSFGI